MAPDPLQSRMPFRPVAAVVGLWLVATTGILLYGVWDRAQTGYVGLTFGRYSGGGWELLEVIPKSPADRKRIREDWVLKSIDGHALGSLALLDLPESLQSRKEVARWQEKQRWLRGLLKPGGRVKLEFETPQGGPAVVVEVESRRTPWWLVFRRTLLYFLVGVAFLALGLIVVHRGSSSRAGHRLLFFCLFHQAFLFTQPLTEFPRGLAIPWMASNVFLEVSDLLFLLSATAIFHFVVAFLEWPARGRVFVVGAAYLLAVAVYVLHLFKVGAPFTLGFGPAVYLLVVGLLFGFHRKTRGSPERRKQIKWLLWGGGVPVVTLLLVWYANFLADTPVRRSESSQLMALSTLAFPAATMLAILRHRLFDIDVIVRRSLLAVVVLPLAGFVYFLIMKAVGGVFDFGNPPVVLLMGLLFLILFLPGQIQVEERLDRLLGRNRYNARMTLQTLAGSLAEADEIEGPVREVSETVRQAMELQCSAVFLSDIDNTVMEPHPSGAWSDPPRALEPSSLQSLEPRCEPFFVEELFPDGVPKEWGSPQPVLCFPLAVGSRIWGVVSLGPRLGRRGWNRGDLEALRLVTRALAMTVDRIYHQRLLQKVRAMQAQVIHTGRLAALGTLAAGVAHELNTPLGYVKSNAQVLAQLLPGALPKGSGEDLMELVSDIGEGAEQMRAVVANLRSFSQVDSQGKRRVDLNAAIERSLSMMKKSRPAGVNLAVEFQEIPPVMGYPAQLNQMVVNLVTNAWDATGQDGEVRLETGSREQEVWFRVVDNGPGIPDEILDKIFDPFFTTKSVGEGMGLGLSITRTIVESHGGALTVGSRSDGEQGVEARVVLPVEVEPGSEGRSQGEG
mgnify:CR=1 FL=1